LAFNLLSGLQGIGVKTDWTRHGDSYFNSNTYFNFLNLKYKIESLNNENIIRMADSVVQAVIKKFLERSELGKKKYGVTLDRTDLKAIDWIVHAQEELMDGILYLEKLKTQKGIVSEETDASMKSE
jgi:hypothetical protein